MGIVFVQKPWEQDTGNSRKATKVRFWFQPVKKDRCNCGRKAAKVHGGVFSWGEYVKGHRQKLGTFCIHCFVTVVQEPLHRYGRKVVRGEADVDRQGVELKYYGKDDPPAWVKLKRVMKPRPPKVKKEIQVMGQTIQVKDVASYTCPECGTVGGCRCNHRAETLELAKPKGPEFIYECSCGFWTACGIRAAEHSLLRGHGCVPTGPGISDPVAERRAARLKASAELAIADAGTRKLGGR